MTTRHSFCLLKSALSSPTGGGHSVSIVRSRTKAIELVILESSGRQLGLGGYEGADECWSCREILGNTRLLPIC
jgi:hypothetical protein